MFPFPSIYYATARCNHRIVNDKYLKFALSSYGPEGAVYIRSQACGSYLRPLCHWEIGHEYRVGMTHHPTMEANFRT